MTEKAVSAALEIDYNTDTYKTALEKTYDVLDDIYGEVNLLYKMSYTTNGTAPSAPETGTLWLDGQTATPILKYWDGAAWTSITGSTTFTSGIALDDAFKGFSHNVILQPNGTTWSSPTIKVVASATKPATLVADGVLLQNTSTVTLTLSGASGVYDIWAQRPGGAGTNFTLAFVASGGTPTFAYEQVKIGRAYWNGMSAFHLRSEEEDIGLNANQFPYAYCHTWRYGMALATTSSYQTITHNNNYIDPDGCYNTTTGEYTVPRIGWYRVTAHTTLYSNAMNTYTIAIAVNGTATWAHAQSGQYYVGIPISLDFYFDQGAKISVQIKNQSGGDGILTNHPNQTFLRVERLGM